MVTWHEPRLIDTMAAHTLPGRVPWRQFDLTYECEQCRDDRPQPRTLLD